MLSTIKLCVNRRNGRIDVQREWKMKEMKAWRINIRWIQLQLWAPMHMQTEEAFITKAELVKLEDRLESITYVLVS